MKCDKYLILLMAFAILLPVSALARERNEGKINLYDSAQIGKTVLKPGTYTVKWMGSGPQVQVSVLQNKDTVATTTGTLKEENNIHQDAVVLNEAPNHAAPEEVAEIDFGSRKEALVLTPASTSQNR